MYLPFRALSFLLSSSLGNRGFQYFPKPKVEKRSNNRAMLTSFLGNFAFRSSIKLSCVISVHFLHILVLTFGPGRYWHCSSSEIFHQKPHGFPTVFYAPAVPVSSVSLTPLFSLTFTSSVLVCQTSRPLLVPCPPPHLDPKMSALSHQPPYSLSLELWLHQPCQLSKQEWASFNFSVPGLFCPGLSPH